MVARGKIEIDVGPLAAILIQESLEEQLHADGINRGDFERIANRGVGCRTAPLHEETVPLAVADDVPDDQKISCETQLCNQCEFMPHLRACLVEQVPFGW